MLVPNKIMENQRKFKWVTYIINWTYDDIPLGKTLADEAKIPMAREKHNPEAISIGMLNHHFWFIISLLYLFITIFIL